MSITHPKISIVILAGKNRKAELLRCLRTIYLSTYKNFEVIVVDNSCNSELSIDINRTFSKVKIIKMLINTGIYGFNIGFANSKGDYLLGIDDDCGIRKDTLRNVVKVYKHKPSYVAVISSNIYNPLYKYYITQNYVDKDIKNLYSFADGGSVFKKEIFEKVGYYDNDFFCWQHNDDLAIRMLNKGYKINFEKTIIIDHYEKKRTFRPDFAYLSFRNFVWFNIKHFSPFFWPLLFFRNIVSFVRLPLIQKTPLACLYSLLGYLTGIITCYKAFKKREVVSLGVQKKFLKYYLFNEHLQD